MPLFRVMWEIDLDAEAPREAARLARQIQLDPESIATVFRIGISVPDQLLLPREHLVVIDLLDGDSTA